MVCFDVDIVEPHSCLLVCSQINVAIEVAIYFGYDRNMIGNRYIAEIAGLIGDSARANILFALQADDQISAGELAIIANVSNSTASEHLAKLVQGGLVTFVKEGRQKYFKLRNEAVAEILRNMESLARITQGSSPELPKWDHVHVHARKCMDHVAGKLGCGIAGDLIKKGHVSLDSNGADLSKDGERWLEGFGIDPEKLRNGHRRLITVCPDWVENSPHLGGAVGAALMKDFIVRDWIRRDHCEGVTRITPKGVHGFRQEFGLHLRVSGQSS